MQTFETPGAVLVSVECASGDVVVDTHDAPSTEVNVRALRDDAATREAVENTRVELLERGDGYEVAIAVPKRSGSFLGRDPKIRIEVRAPHGSDLSFSTASADVSGRGRLGSVRGKTASGDVTVSDVAEVKVESASGDLRVADVSGSASLKTASGDIKAGRVGGLLDATAVSGDVRVDSAESGGSASAVSGDIDLTAVSEGEVNVRTVSGDVTVGVREGARVHVDVTTVTGDLKSDVPLDEVPGEGASGPLVDVRGRTVSGDLRIRRAAPARGLNRTV
jgi:DUF4097 and DUF4098 domain-containing protein YvlB